MELSFSTDSLKAKLCDKDLCYRELGEKRGRLLIGLLADFRTAFFAGEVPGGPTTISSVQGNYKLIWPFDIGCTLVTLTDGVTTSSWKDAYRIHIDYLVVDGSEAK
ncbi:hypothetical protein PsAD2_01828 [Pseudovibrio axinellae]|uniref:Uncharacterized protein n=1 Tax=Pseudovibrio axinellae TaxID=989403 RepID=A0A165Z6C2_9HYPH|nr:hypothetical protein PsAD2_01828 [Pseudovibrio axinellae]SEQ31549.1 hypothetical protein SAMN05421798_102389 [Pseudovibrio axinellae]